MPMPMGMHNWFPVLGTALPGMEAIMTAMMKSKMKSKGVASVEELRSICIEADVKMVGCQMTIDLFDWNPKDFIGGVELGGAATYLAASSGADVTLFI